MRTIRASGASGDPGHQASAEVARAYHQDQIDAGLHVRRSHCEIPDMHGVAHGVVAIGLVAGRHRQPELVSECHQILNRAGLPDFIPHHQQRTLCRDQPFGALFDRRGFRPRARIE